MFYAGFGAILTPAFGVAAAYGDDMTQYYNALGFFLMRKLLLFFSVLGIRPSDCPFHAIGRRAVGC